MLCVVVFSVFKFDSKQVLVHESLLELVLDQNFDNLVIELFVSFEKEEIQLMAAVL